MSKRVMAAELKKIVEGALVIAEPPALALSMPLALCSISVNPDALMGLEEIQIKKTVKMTTKIPVKLMIRIMCPP